MGMRKYYRQIARARIKAAGAGKVNKKMSSKKGGVPLWRRLVFGDLAKEAEAYQVRPTRQADKLKRKIRKIA